MFYFLVNVVSYRYILEMYMGMRKTGIPREWVLGIRWAMGWESELS